MTQELAEPITEVEEPLQLDETARVLMRAAEIVRERWGQFGCGFGKSGRRCISFSIGEAAYGEKFTGIHLAHNRAVASLGGHDITTLFEFNDAPGRTAEDVALA